MSEAGRSSAGAVAADGAAVIALAEIGVATAWNVRGNPARPAFVREAGRALGLALPLRPNTSVRAADTTLLWLGPRSWLWWSGAPSLQEDFDAARAALEAAGGALFDVSSSQVAWSVSGAAAARVLNRTCPLDLHPRTFPAGHCAQSMLGHITALFYRPDEGQAFIVMAARSFAADGWATLCASAASDGYRAEQPARDA